jgi:peptidoglycan/LPS O-acetylase OafA/YrhL
MQAATGTHGRQYGLDWLRIGAFALLILYHVGMFFVPWGWHVKADEPVEWAIWPMMAINPWRLMLLFVISGVVSRALLSKLSGPGAFARSRTVRLIVPLLAGMALFVAPQPWFELRDQGAYQASFLHFWLNDYFEFGSRSGLVLPTWNHLWFVAYLLVYSLLLAVIGALPASVRQRLQQTFDALFSGWRLLVLPIVWLAWARLVLHPAFGETHALADDPYAHAIYGFAFFFGVALAGSKAVWAQIDAQWRGFLVLAIAACITMLVPHAMSGNGPLWDLIRSAARAVLAWTMILGLLGFARAHLNFDGPPRRYLTEAIFPYYIAHQTIIVAAGFWAKQVGLGNGTAFAIILAATMLGCGLAYEIARRVRWLRPVMGLKIASTAKPGSEVPASARNTTELA